MQEELRVSVIHNDIKRERIRNGEDVCMQLCVYVSDSYSV